MAEEQRGQLRGNVSGEIKEAQTAIDRFVARWQVIKPAEMRGGWGPEAVEAVFSALAGQQAELDSVKRVVAAVQESCESFGLAPPVFEALVAAEADVLATAAVWGRYKAYGEERAVLASQDWISFRARVFELQDFAAKWGEAARAGGPGGAVGTDIVSQRIHGECEALRRAAGALKFARGEPFKEEHWTAMFKKLGMPKGVRLETLTVAHMLDALEPLAASVSWLKDLHSRAQGEVTIREAMQELKAWCDTTEFKLMEHVSNAGGGQPRRCSLIR